MLDRRLGGGHSPTSDTLANDDGLRAQYVATRRHVEELPADAPEAAHLLGVLDALPTAGQPIAPLRLSLTAYAHFLEHEARLAEALEVLALAVRTYGGAMGADEFAACALFAGRLNRLGARWEVANSCYEAAEAAAETIGDVESVLRSRLGRAHVARARGNLPEARSKAEAVGRHAATLGLPELQADAQLDLGVVLMLQGLQAEALQATYTALLLTQDSTRRARILGDLGYALNQVGAYDVARTAFEIVLASRASFLVRTNALLELMELESAVGNRIAFERCRAAADQSRARMSPSMTVDLQYKTGIGLARFGQLGRAREALSGALRLAEQHRLNEWYFRIERVIENLAACPDADAGLDTSPPCREAPAVNRMATALREYAALATV